jgi:hypothetical protein
VDHRSLVHRPAHEGQAEPHRRGAQPVSTCIPTTGTRRAPARAC